MFLPLIIAILLGLVNPTNTNNSTCNGGGTVYVNTSDPNSGDPNDPGSGDGEGEGEGGDTGGETGIGGPGSGGPGGNTGQTNPPPPKP